MKNNLEEIGRAHIEQGELKKKVECLKSRLSSIGAACTMLAGNPLHDASQESIVQATDPREDFSELLKSLTRLSELEKLLRQT